MSISSVYEQYFGLEEPPFSITPDPRFVYLSDSHRAALDHLVQGATGGANGFVLLTGDVGTGKTTICRTFLEHVPPKTEVALILNPVLTLNEFLQTICEELDLVVDGNRESNKNLIDHLNRFLLQVYAVGQKTILIVDEAQNLTHELLEQIRLLTNLETNTDKLLQIFLIGQPELRDTLDRPDMQQVSQRITSRYHLGPLNKGETREYIRKRLEVAGTDGIDFTGAAIQRIYKFSNGVPRIINVLCDKALLCAYENSTDKISDKIVRLAQQRLRGDFGETRSRFGLAAGFAMVSVLAAGILGAAYWNNMANMRPWVDARLASVAAVFSPDAPVVDAPSSLSGREESSLLSHEIETVESLESLATTAAGLPDDTAPQANEEDRLVAEQRVAQAPDVTEPAIATPAVVATEPSDEPAPTGRDDVAQTTLPSDVPEQADGEQPPISDPVPASPAVEQHVDVAAVDESEPASVADQQAHAPAEPDYAIQADQVAGVDRAVAAVDDDRATPPPQSAPAVVQDDVMARAESIESTIGDSSQWASPSTDAAPQGRLVIAGDGPEPAAAENVAARQLPDAVTGDRVASVQSREPAVVDAVPSPSSPAVSKPAVSNDQPSAAVPQSEGPVAPPRSVQQPAAPRSGGSRPVQTLTGYTRKVAERKLLAMWNIDKEPPAGMGFCQFAQRNGLQCLREERGLSKLYVFNRPAIISMKVGDLYSYAVVIKATPENVVLDVLGRQHVIPADVLPNVWDGRFLVLWRGADSFGGRELVQGARGQSVLKLRKIIDQIDGTLTSGDVYDAALVARVKQFQSSAGLEPDGIVGPRTHMVMQNKLAELEKN